MALKKGNEPAFPCPSTDDGLSKREYFAGQAMQAMLTNHATSRGFDDIDPAALAWAAFRYADAMIAKMIEEDSKGV